MGFPHTLSGPAIFLPLFKLTNKDATTVLCSVVKHAGSGRARKKCREKHETKSSVFPHFLSALPLPKCITTAEHSRGFFICVMIKNPIISPHLAEFSNQTFFSKRGKVASAVYYLC